MSKKPVAKKAKAKPAAKRRTTKTPTIGKMTGGVVVGGSIKAGRDVIMGDQYNDLRQQVAQIASPAEFVARAQELQAKIAEIKKQPDLLPAQVETIEVVEGQVKQAIEEAHKPQPLAARINATLTGAKAVMDSLGDSVKAAVGLGTVLAGLGQIAIKLFGG
jgi:hypothetical protein